MHVSAPGKKGIPAGVWVTGLIVAGIAGLALAWLLDRFIIWVQPYLHDFGSTVLSVLPRVP